MFLPLLRNFHCARIDNTHNTIHHTPRLKGGWLVCFFLLPSLFDSTALWLISPYFTRFIKTVIVVYFDQLSGAART